ncbi:MAG: HigA family addiction module antidote protein [Saprospirales bacterium]|nr:HigA family addiction module antidote protein [Saprospirales bacterium]
MIPISQIRPAKKFGPGYFIREQIELRSWTQDELAEVTGFSQKHISELLNDKKPVSLDMARVLGEVFNTSPQYWMNLDTGYRLWAQAEKSDKEAVADIKAQIYERMPIRDMVKKADFLDQIGRRAC